MDCCHIRLSLNEERREKLLVKEYIRLRKRTLLTMINSITMSMIKNISHGNAHARFAVAIVNIYTEKIVFR